MVDYSKVAFTSQYRYERVVLKDSMTFSIGGGGFGSTTLTIPHNLGYRPYYQAWYKYDGDNRYLQLFTGPGSYNLTGNGGQMSSINMTDTDLVIYIENFGAGAISGTVYYRIYAEPQI